MRVVTVLNWIHWPAAGRRRWVLAGAGAALLLLFGAAGWYWWDTRQTAGLSAFSRASSLAQDALSPQARPEQLEAARRALDEFITRYPRHPAVRQAAYALGNLHYQVKAYEAARDAYQMALRKGATQSLAALSRLAIGYTWEAQGNYSNALAAYQEAVAAGKARNYLYEEGLLAVARAQELLQQRAQALETYRRVLRELPESRRAEEIRSRTAAIEGGVR